MTVNPAASLLEPFRIEPPKELRAKQKPRDARGRCYELSGRYMLDHPEGTMLVHGILGGVVPHAWVELVEHGLVYDGTCGGFFKIDGYYHTMGAEPVRKMGSKETASVMLAAGRWQACPELDERVRGRA